MLRGCSRTFRTLILRPCRRVATKLCLGGGFLGTQTHLPPKFSFFLGFRPLYFENDGKCKVCIYVKKKDTEILLFLGDVPRKFFDCGGRVPPAPPPPISTPMRPCVVIRVLFAFKLMQKSCHPKCINQLIFMNTNHTININTPSTIELEKAVMSAN